MLSSGQTLIRYGSILLSFQIAGERIQAHAAATPLVDDRGINLVFSGPEGACA